MKDNTCNYSDEWQPYIGDYDKYEYDVKLHDGRIIENTYPNAGKFHGLSDEEREAIEDKDIAEIRFSQNPVYGINGEVSNVEQSNEPKIAVIGSGEVGRTALPEHVEPKDLVMVDTETLPYYPFMQGIDKYVMHIPHDPKNRKAYPGGVRIETVEPKIPRNQPCPCGSGKKYKKCCGK